MTSINAKTEELIHFTDAGRLFPGRKPCIQTLHRWRLNGVRGVKLGTILVGGLRYTTSEEVQRFIAAQNADDNTAPAVTPKQRESQSNAARRELEKLGV